MSINLPFKDLNIKISGNATSKANSPGVLVHTTKEENTIVDEEVVGGVDLDRLTNLLLSPTDANTKYIINALNTFTLKPFKVGFRRLVDARQYCSYMLSDKVPFSKYVSLSNRNGTLLTI